MDTQASEISSEGLVSLTNSTQQLTDEEVERLKNGDFLYLVRNLKLELLDKTNECELLKIRANESSQEIELLSKELNECKLTIFEGNEDSRRAIEETRKCKKLEEDNVKLMRDFLDLCEQNEQYKQNLVDNYLAKSNLINNLECFMSSDALSNELNECKAGLDSCTAELNLSQAKVRFLEEENQAKDKSINELKKSLDDAKVTHKHEINVLEEYIRCLKNTISSYEKTLTNYMEQTPQNSLDK